MPRPQKKKPDTKSTRDRMKAMIAAFADSGNVVYAARIAGIERKTHYRWLKQYPQYREVFNETRHAAAEYLESAAVERASEGWLEPIYYQGTKCGSVRRYDGGLMQFLLRGMMPEKYGAKTEITGSVEIIERLQAGRKRVIEMRRQNVVDTGS